MAPILGRKKIQPERIVHEDQVGVAPGMYYTPAGGVKEKILGAVRAGIRTVVLPKENVPDLEDLPQDVRDGLEIVPVQDLSEALAVSLRGHVRDGQLLFTQEASGPGKETPVAH